MGLISYGQVNDTYAEHLRKYDFKEFVGEAFNRFKYFTVAGLDERRMYFGMGNAIASNQRELSQVNIFILWCGILKDGHPFVNQWHLNWFRTVQTVLSEK